METDQQRVYREDAGVLAELGDVVARADIPRFEVRLPRRLAELAVRAWERDDDEAATPDPETCEQRVHRDRAAVLALIGIGIQERGRWEADEVVVDLDAVFLADAITAADDPPAA